MSVRTLLILFFFFNDTATTEIYTLSLHDASSDPTRRSGLVCSAWSAASADPPPPARGVVATMAKRSAPRPLSVPLMDAPSARAASLASSAACRPAPGAGHSRAVDPPGNPPVIPPGIPPATDGGGSASPLGAIDPGQVPFGGPVGRTTGGRLAPLGGVVRPRRAVRFARLIDRRGRVLGRTCGPRRLRRRS